MQQKYNSAKVHKLIKRADKQLLDSGVFLKKANRFIKKLQKTFHELTSHTEPPADNIIPFPKR